MSELKQEALSIIIPCAKKAGLSCDEAIAVIEDQARHLNKAMSYLAVPAEYAASNMRECIAAMESMEPPK